MSTYSNEPQQTKWEIWFVTSVILLLSILFYGAVSNTEKLPIIYDILILVSIANLIYCLIVGISRIK